MPGRCNRLTLLAVLGLVLGLVAPLGHAAAARAASATPVPGVATDCPVTPYVEGGLGDNFTPTWYGGGDFWAGLIGAQFGLWFAEPEIAKVHWTLPSGAALSIEGSRLDASALPLDTGSTGGYSGGGFQVTILTFPTAGCWEVVGRIPERELRFIVFVHPGDELHNAPLPTPDRWETLSRPVELPTIAAGAPCPRTPTRTIARLEGVVLGDGPVYVQGLGADGRVPFGDAAASGDVPPVSTRWVTDPAYLGPLLIRSHRLDGPETLTFGSDGPEPAIHVWDQADLTTPDWSVWGARLRLPGPGCYALQIDGLDFTQVVVFEVVPGPRSAPPEPQPRG